MLVGMIMKGIELVRSLKKDDKGAPIEWHFCYAYHSSTWMHVIQTEFCWLPSISTTYLSNQVHLIKKQAN